MKGGDETWFNELNHLYFVGPRIPYIAFEYKKLSNTNILFQVHFSLIHLFLHLCGVFSGYQKHRVMNQVSVVPTNLKLRAC